MYAYILVINGRNDQVMNADTLLTFECIASEGHGQLRYYIVGAALLIVCSAQLL
jgi:hypothetical protein